LSKLASLSLLAVVGLAANCHSAPRFATRPGCPPAWIAAWSADSTVALCLPSTFARRGAHSWSRPGPPAPAGEFLSVKLLRWPEDSSSLHSWPPQLASPPSCQADCGTADSVSVYRDSVAGFDARTEVGLVSGGQPGFRRAPMIISGWVLSPDRRGFAQGWASAAAILDTLRLAMRTVRVAR
jgi:hypothetical protein